MEDMWGLHVSSGGFIKLVVIFSEYSEVIFTQRNPKRKEHADDDKRICWLVLSYTMRQN